MDNRGGSRQAERSKRDLRVGFTLLETSESPWSVITAAISTDQKAFHVGVSGRSDSRKVHCAAITRLALVNDRCEQSSIAAGYALCLINKVEISNGLYVGFQFLVLLI